MLSAQPVIPGAEVVAVDFTLKKTGHIIIYGIFYYLIYRSLKTDNRHIWQISLLSFIIAILYAMSDEYHQTLVPGRTGTIKDIGYDTLGMLISWLYIHRYI